MAGRKENLKALFTNTRSRIIIIFTVIVLLIAILIGITHFIRASNKENLSSDVPNAPGIQSIPGTLNPTVQYAKLQEAQNVNQATKALDTGGSAIPTIIRSQELGAGVGVIGGQNGESGVGFTKLAHEDEAGLQRNAWIQQLENNSCSKSSIDQVVTQGANLSDIKNACNCIQLKDSGYQIGDLQKVCSCKELKAAGFNARQLKEIGYNTQRLRLCGFDACELRNAGFSAQEMKDGGYSDGELKGAGFTENDIARASGLPEGITEAEVRKGDCQLASLKHLRAVGVSASAIRRISGCNAAQLKAAGFTAKELKDAGFTAADLKKAGFTPEELRQAGYSARDLLDAGFTPDELSKAGYTPAEILAGETELLPGITPEDVLKAGCDVDSLKNERLAGISAKSIKQYADCSAQALKAAGFTNDDLANAGFTPQQIATPATSDDAIRAAGCDPNKLRVLFKQGVSAKQIHTLNGCSAAQLKAAGYDAKALLDAGFTPKELLAAGFTPQQLAQAGVNPSALIAKGRVSDCSIASLTAAKAAGISATTIRQTLGCSAAAMKAAGFTAKELKDAGFTAAELKNAGFTAAELKAAGFSAKELKDAGFTAKELKDAGFSASQLKDAGFSAADLRAAGFTANQLKAAGFSAKDLKDAGFTAKELKDAGFTAKELKDAGFSANDLKNAGFNAKELKDAGFNAKELKDAGFRADELRAGGFALKELQNAGYTDDQLKSAGFSAAELSQIAGLNEPGVSQGIPSTMPSIAGYQNKAVQANVANAQQLQNIMKRQNRQLADQRYQQRIQQRTSEMLAVANQSLQEWKKIPTQIYTQGNQETNKKNSKNMSDNSAQFSESGQYGSQNINVVNQQKALIKMGDILFGVIDTSVNSDEPGPILATIVSGKLRGAKLIGSFNLPSNAEKMVITFTTMSVPGASKSTSIHAYAIDADTARTALSSNTDHHYLLRYGSLFASSFLEGFGNAFQSAGTTVTVGGTGGGNNITVQNGIGRSALENAVIAFATVGKSWGQVAQQQFSRPTTVEVYSGTGVGILFVQDVTSL